MPLLICIKGEVSNTNAIFILLSPAFTLLIY